jgi:predicted RND superfamily exporter protein
MSFSSMPTLITAIGVAHSVHILSGFRVAFRRLGDRRAALVQTLSLVGTPCLLTSLTTSVGFASMSFVPIKSISHQGVYASFGVMAAFVAVASFVLRARVAILVAFAALFVWSAVGMARLVVDSNWLDDFSEDVPHKAIAIHIDEVMGGLTNIIAIFDTGQPDGIKEPSVLREIDRVQQWANGEDLVRKSYSIVDVLKDLNQTFHEDDPSWYRIPDSRELVAQYLIMYESAGGTEASSYVTSDYQRATLEMRLRIDTTSKTADLVDDVNALLATQPLEASTMTLTGIGALWVKLLDYIVTSQVQGFLTAFAVIGAMMCVLLRSFRTGVIVMLPNLSPVFLTLGFMGWAGILLDYSKVAIAAVAMGIAVDDTIHLIARFRHEFEQRHDYEAALRASLGDVGRALIITSVALIAGFLMLQASVLDTTATRGLLLAGTIAAALLADFLLLPALVLTFRPFGPEGERAGTGDAELREAA